MKLRSVLVALALGAASPLVIATPALAHGCTLTANPPVRGGGTVTGTSTFDCRPTAHESGSKIELWTYLVWQDSDGNVQWVRMYGWDWAGPNGSQYKSVTVNIPCPTVPTTYSTLAEGWILHPDGSPDHYKTVSSPGVLVDPVTCLLLPRVGD